MPTQLPSRERPHALVVDGTGLFTRCFFACISDGKLEETPVAFAQSLAKTLRARQPTHVAIALDPRGKTFRELLYDGYKASRPPKPDGFPRVEYAIESLLRDTRAPVFVRGGFEADDIAASATATAVANEIPVVIISDDKDLEQLVRIEPLVVIWRNRETVIGIEEVTKRRGVPPELFAYALALSGDEHDDIPGVPGIGPATAARILMSEHGIDKILREPWWCPVKQVRQALRAHREQVALYLQLTKLRADALTIDIEQMRVDPLRLADRLLRAARPIDWHRD